MIFVTFAISRRPLGAKSHTSWEGAEVAAERWLGLKVALERVDVESLRVVDGPSAVRHCYDFATVELQQLCSPSTHIAKSLCDIIGVMSVHGTLLHCTCALTILVLITQRPSKWVPCKTRST